MEPKICIFCGLPITDDWYTVLVQVVFGGWRQYPQGKFMIKQPGVHLFYHRVCGVPDAEPKQENPDAKDRA